MLLCRRWLGPHSPVLVPRHTQPATATVAQQVPWPQVLAEAVAPGLRQPQPPHHQHPSRERPIYSFAFFSPLNLPSPHRMPLSGPEDPVPTHACHLTDSPRCAGPCDRHVPGLGLAVGLPQVACGCCLFLWYLLSATPPPGTDAAGHLAHCGSPGTMDSAWHRVGTR